MNKIEWQSGPPKNDGIYWLDSGFRKGAKVFIAQCYTYEGELNTHVFGDHGSMPLSGIYHEKLKLKIKHAKINLPSDWKDFKQVKKNTRMWVKHPDGYIGFGLLREDRGLSGSIVWLDNPDSGSICGIWINESDGYLFSPVEEP